MVSLILWFVGGSVFGWKLHTLIIVQNVPLMIPTTVVSFSDGHGVVGEVYIAVIT